MNALFPFCRFVLIYILLMIPWPGWNGMYCGFFREMTSWVFTESDGQRELSIEPLETPTHPHYTRVVIVNRSLMNTDGSGPVRNLDLDTIGFGWKPVALLVALIAATPIPWKRRASALCWGLLWEHILILLSLNYCIWNDSTEVSLVTLTPFWKHMADGLKDSLIAQISLAVPVVVWILVTFRRRDWTIVNSTLADDCLSQKLSATKSGAPLRRRS